VFQELMYSREWFERSRIPRSYDWLVAWCSR